MNTNFQSSISNNTHGHYRQHPSNFKRALVALSFEPGDSVARIDREYGVNANQIFSWRRLYEQGRFGLPALMRHDGLLPVMLAPSVPALSNAIADATADADVDEIIELKLGEVRVHIEGHAIVKEVKIQSAQICHVEREAIAVVQIQQEARNHGRLASVTLCDMQQTTKSGFAFHSDRRQFGLPVVDLAAPSVHDSFGAGLYPS